MSCENRETKIPDFVKVVGYLIVGIESRDNQHSFTNGTFVEIIWTYPVGGSGFQNYTGTAPVAAENNNRGWYSLWFPIQNGNPNTIQFLW